MSENGLGDCFEAAGRYITSPFARDEASDDLVLVHAEVMGQGPLEGVTFGHAWVLNTRNNTVIDKSNGRDIIMPRAVYYAIGGVDRIGNVWEYTRVEAVEKILEWEHWGPWDLITSSGL